MEIYLSNDGYVIGHWRYSRIDGWIWEGAGAEPYEPQDNSDDYPDGELRGEQREAEQDILNDLGQ
jgi:hypothetical protein